MNQQSDKTIKQLYSSKKVFELNGSIHKMRCTQNCEVNFDNSSIYSIIGR